MINAKDLGARLKKEREKKGLTQAAVANRLGYAQSATISRFETGERMPSLEMLDLMAEIFDTTLSALLAPDSPTSKVPEVVEMSEILATLKEILATSKELLSIAKK